MQTFEIAEMMKCAGIIGYKDLASIIGNYVCPDEKELVELASNITKHYLENFIDFEMLDMTIFNKLKNKVYVYLISKFGYDYESFFKYLHLILNETINYKEPIPSNYYYKYQNDPYNYKCRFYDFTYLKNDIYNLIGPNNVIKKSRSINNSKYVVIDEYILLFFGKIFIKRKVLKPFDIDHLNTYDILKKDQSIRSKYSGRDNINICLNKLAIKDKNLNLILNKYVIITLLINNRIIYLNHFKPPDNLSFDDMKPLNYLNEYNTSKGYNKYANDSDDSDSYD